MSVERNFERPGLAMSVTERAVNSFGDAFGCRPSLVAAAPGRINLIGEHVDYNAGWVLPFAIDRRIVVAAGATDDSTIKACSAAMGAEFQFSLDDESAKPSGAWQDYVRGAATLLKRMGAPIGGASLYIGGDLPPGSGLSSSAALTVAISRALAALFEFSVEPRELALMCQRVEHEFAGTPCGIMDPYVSNLAREGTALLIDCIANTHEFIPLRPEGVSFLVIPSGIKHALADGAYASRRSACEQALEIVGNRFDSVQSMRDVTPAMLEACDVELDAETKRRARYVVGELERIHQAADAVRRCDWPRLGRLMTETQRGLRDDYEVSCDEIDRMIELLDDQSAVLGARMIGGGFGGVVVALVGSEAIDTITHVLRSGYYEPTNIIAEPFPVTPQGGASVSHI